MGAGGRFGKTGKVQISAAGQVDDEATHAKFHSRVSNGIDFGVR